MEDDPSGYLDLEDSAPKPLSKRSLLTIAVMVTIAAVGVICALYFTIGGYSDANLGFTLDVDPTTSADYLGCRIETPYELIGLQCAYNKPTRSWLCLDQDETSLQIYMSFLDEIRDFEVMLKTETDGITRETLVCSQEVDTWMCFFLSSYDRLGENEPRRFNPNGLMCARTNHVDWICMRSEQNVTFTEVGTLATTLSPYAPGTHTLGCLLDSDLTWQCGDLYNCLFHANLGWSCWGGNATTTMISSVPWFSHKHDDLHGALISGHKAENITEQLCFYSSKQDAFHCADGDNDEEVELVGHYNHTTLPAYQCAYRDNEWTCLRDEKQLKSSTLLSMSSCVNATAIALDSESESEIESENRSASSNSNTNSAEGNAMRRLTLRRIREKNVPEEAKGLANGEKAVPWMKRPSYQEADRKEISMGSATVKGKRVQGESLSRKGHISHLDRQLVNNQDQGPTDEEIVGRRGLLSAQEGAQVRCTRLLSDWVCSLAG